MAKKSLPLTYGVLGYPVKHSFSPAMQNAALRAAGIKASYKLFEVKPADLEDFILSLEENNILGLNVTIPYKEKVLDYIGGYRSSGVKVIGAANTLRLEKNGRLSAFNTDFAGFSRHLQELKLKPRNVAVIGAGGAAKAVCYALANKGSRRIVVFDIDKFKSIALVDRLAPVFSSTDFTVATSIGELAIQQQDLLVNASPVGMKSDDPCLVDPGMLHPGLFVYDLIYNPLRTKLLELAASRGLGNANGLDMLLYQAVLSFRHWTGKDASEGPMRRALERELKKCR